MAYRPSAEGFAIESMPIAFPFVQALPDDRVLIVGARCVWQPAGPEANAYVYGSTGEVLNAAVLGDGIAHVQSDTEGKVWVGYHDEGVFGNYGWGRPGPEPIGSCGLIRWSSDLKAEWRHPQNSEFGSIDDCYALNVRGATAWAYYYSDFPIIAVDTVAQRGWLTDASGARALVTDGERVALVGGYQSERNRVVTGHLDEGIFSQHRQHHLMLGDGRPLAGAFVTGRGEELHAFVDGDWFKASIDDLFE